MSTCIYINVLSRLISAGGGDSCTSRCFRETFACTYDLCMNKINRMRRWSKIGFWFRRVKKRAMETNKENKLERLIVFEFYV